MVKSAAKPSPGQSSRPVEQLQVTGLAAGGEAVARDPAGRVVFVARGVPGDIVSAEIVESKASFARARIAQVVTPSADRRDSGCAAFDRGCGGCQWLHIDESAQRKAKHHIVQSALHRVAPGVVVGDVAFHTPSHHWRRRARLHVHAGLIGFYGAQSRHVIGFQSCAQLDPRLDAVVSVLSRARPPAGELLLTMGMDGNIAVVVAAPWPVGQSLIGTAGISSVTHAGPTQPTVEVDQGVFIAANGFAQASATGNAALVDHVLAAVTSNVGVAGRVLELFAGGGNFTRGLISAGFKVTASDAVAAVRWTHQAPFLVGEAHNIAAGQPPGRYDAVVLDPPRIGAKELMPALIAMSPAVIVYVSCDPATLARDVSMLLAGGYRLTSTTPHDLMPQTAHIETVCVLRKP
jgi:23S rRNA (uracil1939-C5)-methyltransferase